MVTKKAYLTLSVVRRSQTTLKEDGCLLDVMAAVGRNCYTAACWSLKCPAFLVEVFAVNPNEKQKVARAQMWSRTITSLLSIKPLLASSYCSFPALPWRHPVCCRKGSPIHKHLPFSLQEPGEQNRTKGSAHAGSPLQQTSAAVTAALWGCSWTTCWHPRQVRRRQWARIYKRQKLRGSVQRKHFLVYLKVFSSATHSLNAAAPVWAHMHQLLSFLKNNTTTASLLLRSTVTGMRDKTIVLTLWSHKQWSRQGCLSASDRESQCSPTESHPWVMMGDTKLDSWKEYICVLHLQFHLLTIRSKKQIGKILPWLL